MLVTAAELIAPSAVIILEDSLFARVLVVELVSIPCVVTEPCIPSTRPDPLRSVTVEAEADCI